MTELFDSTSSYRAVVQSSIDFSGLPHSFFMRAKADLLRELIAAAGGQARYARCRLRGRQLSSAARHDGPAASTFQGQHHGEPNTTPLTAKLSL